MRIWVNWWWGGGAKEGGADVDVACVFIFMLSNSKILAGTDGQ